MEGFQRVEEQSPDWPAEGAKIVWDSGPGGRGRVTEKVSPAAPTAFGTLVYEERLRGHPDRSARPSDGDGSRVEVTLDYELTSDSPLKPVTDLLFIRRALRDALGRTLRRFAVEAEDEAGLEVVASAGHRHEEDTSGALTGKVVADHRRRARDRPGHRAGLRRARDEGRDRRPRRGRGHAGRRGRARRDRACRST